MSLRSRSPGYGPEYVVSISRFGEESRAAFEPWAFWTLILIIPVLAIAGIASASALLFRDEIFLGLMQRQSHMQAAYEERIDNMRSHIDKLASRQLLDRDTLEGQVQELLSRQAQLESRSSMVAALAQSAGVNDPRAPEAPRQNVARTDPGAANAGKLRSPAVAGGAPSFATPATNAVRQPPSANAQAHAASTLAAPALAEPANAAPTRTMPLKPVPDSMEFVPLRGSNAQRGAALSRPDLPANMRLTHVAQSIENVDAIQVRTLENVANAARRESLRLRAAFAELGVHADRFVAKDAKLARGGAKAMGGPFVPFKLNPDGSTFEREVSRLQEDVRIADRLRRAIADAPLGSPLPASAEATSNFGPRRDPFLGRMAYHSGIDFREAHGAPVRATGPGLVTSSGSSGGYGLMVEIDHGGGMTTRYAHLSALLVKEGQFIPAGAVIGRLGSTGRSTGPHLHYEVRIDDEPVDPMRFLRAGARLLAQN
jgi:murein DD-endopeptidase MepM/ murein hydrolase activator NlpD